MQARKPFSMTRKQSFTQLPKYSRRFKIQPSKNENSYQIGVIFFIILLFVSITLLPQWHKYENKRYIKEIKSMRKIDIKAYEFLKKSGIYRLKQKNYKGAISEFELALNLRPHAEDLHCLLFEAKTALNQKVKTYCED